MSLLRTGTRRPETTTDPRDAEIARLRAEVDRLTESLRHVSRTWAKTDEALGRAVDQANEADALADDARSALEDIQPYLLPWLPAGLYDEDPMPATALVSDDPANHDLIGWVGHVPGDRAADWPAVEAVDFAGILAALPPLTDYAVDEPVGVAA